MNHPDIDKAERYGMPEGKPVECAECYRPIFDEDYQCKSCRALVCETCKVRILDNDYCSLECADEDIRHDLLDNESTIRKLKYENEGMKKDLGIIAEGIERLWQYRQENKGIMERPADEPNFFGLIKAKAEWWSK